MGTNKHTLWLLVYKQQKVALSWFPGKRLEVREAPTFWVTAASSCAVSSRDRVNSPIRT